MKRHTVYFEENEEPYMAFDEGNDVVAYQQKMLTFVVPSENEAFLKHIQGASAFLDEIYTLLYERACKKQAYMEGGASRLSLLMNGDKGNSDDEEREVALDILRFDQICDVFFRWHTDVVLRGETMTGMYAVNYFLTWGCFVRAFHLVVYHDEAKLLAYATKTAHKDRYCQMVNRHENVFTTDAMLVEYSIGDLWNSMRIILPSLYTYTYCKPMRAYIYALFFRYGDLLSVQQQQQQQGETESSDYLNAIFDNPLFRTIHSVPQLLGNDADEQDEIAETAKRSQRQAEKNDEDDSSEDEDGLLEAFDAYKNISIPVNKYYSIRNEFLYQGESLYYHQLRRIQISDDLIRYHTQQQAQNKAITIHYPSRTARLDFLKLATEEWCAACVAISTNTYLRKTLIEQYMGTRTEMYLYHGERERYKRQFPASTCEARDILVGIRPLAMTLINSSQHLVIRDIFVAFKTAYLEGIKQQFGNLDSAEYEKDAFEYGLDDWCTFNFEQEVLLLTKLSTTLCFDFEKVTEIKSMSASFILEELVTLQSIENSVFLKRKSKKRGKVWPIFLKLVRLYYVIDPVNDRIFKSLFFVEAYFVWIALSMHHGLLKNSSVLPPELLPPLKKLNTMLQFKD